MINKRLISLINNAKKFITFHVFFQWVGLMANIFAIFLISYLIDFSLTKNVMQDDMILVVSLVFAVIAVRFFCSIFASRMSYLASGRVKQILREKIYRKLLTLGASYKEKFSTSEIIQVSTEGVEQLEIYFGRYLPQFFYSLIAPVTLFVILSFVSFKAAIILLICVPLIPLSIIAVEKVAKKVLKKYWGSYTALGNSFLENLQGLTTLKIYKADERKNIEMMKQAESFRVATMNVLTMQLNSITIMDLIAFVGAALGVIISVSEFLKGNITLAESFAIIMLSAEFFIPLRLLGSFFHIAMNGIAASEKIFNILDMKDDKEKTVGLDSKDTEMFFNNVSFSYDGKKETLKDINMSIKENSFVSIVGKSGSGKSTIARLLTLSNKGYSGSIKIGNKELSEINEDNLMNHITLVDHNSYLFKGTVEDNLKMADENLSEDKMNGALKAVDLYDFFKGEDGLNTSIMEKASNLSGGQRQRLAIARAMLHNGDIYIFDEATSNVDVESEESIMKVIRNISKTKTVVLISHRLFNVKNSDVIYFIKDGIIEEIGNHRTLIEKNGEYAKLYNEQINLENITRGVTLNA